MLHAPWTPAQVEALKAYQACPLVHPYTSAQGTDLIPTEAGWVIEEGGPVVQTWAHDFTMDASWCASLTKALNFP